MYLWWSPLKLYHTFAPWFGNPHVRSTTKDTPTAPDPPSWDDKDHPQTKSTDFKFELIDTPKTCPQPNMSRSGASTTRPRATVRSMSVASPRTMFSQRGLRTSSERVNVGLYMSNSQYTRVSGTKTRNAARYENHAKSPQTSRNPPKQD